MDFGWNRFALIHPRSEEKFLWPNSNHIVPSRGLMLQPAKTETSNKMFTKNCGFGLLDPKTKTARAELFSKGLFFFVFHILLSSSTLSCVVFMILMMLVLCGFLEKVIISSHMGASQDLDGALSLLSNSTSWDQPKRFSLDHHPTSNLQPVAHRSVTQLNSVSGYWQPDPPAVGGTTALHRNGVGQSNENYFSFNQFYN